MAEIDPQLSVGAGHDKYDPVPGSPASDARHMHFVRVRDEPYFAEESARAGKTQHRSYQHGKEDDPDKTLDTPERGLKCTIFGEVEINQELPFGVPSQQVEGSYGSACSQCFEPSALSPEGLRSLN